MLNIISITKSIANQVTKQKYNDDATPRKKNELNYSDHYTTSIILNTMQKYTISTTNTE
jgi:hypothetical protein